MLKRSGVSMSPGESEAKNFQQSMMVYFLVNERFSKFMSPMGLTYILWVSRRIVNEKQHLIPGSAALRSGFFKEQLVNMAFWEVSKAIERNLSQ